MSTRSTCPPPPDGTTLPIGASEPVAPAHGSGAWPMVARRHRGPWSHLGMFAAIVMWLMVIWAVAGAWLIVSAAMRGADDTP